MSNAVAGYNTLFQRGDGGVGAATQASRTIGSSNSQIVIKAKAGVAAVAGANGNTMSCQVVNGGASQALSVSVTGSGANASLTINAATNGSSVITSTVNDMIAACSLNASIDALFDFTTGAGNGTGVFAAAAALAFLTSGANAAEAFTTIGEVSDISGPGVSKDTTEVTHMTSTNRWKEFLSTLRDGGEITIDFNFIPTDSTQTNILADLNANTTVNYRVVWPNAAATKWSFAGICTGFEPGSSVGDKLSASASYKLTGEPNFNA